MRRAAFHLCLFLVLALIAGVATAEPYTVAWKPPTQCTNGQNVGTEFCGEITRYAFRCGPAGGPHTFAWGIEATPGLASDTRDYPDGTYHCVLVARNNVGFSEPSNEISFTIPAIQAAVTVAPELIE